MLHTGFARMQINPPLGTPLVGYYSARFMKGAIDNLYARAVAFDDGETKAVVITADLCMLNRKCCDEYRRLISEFCGIDQDAIIISCSHTHTGPLTTPDFASDMVPPPEYMEYLKIAFRDVAAYALQDMKPSRLFNGEGKAEGISFIRRFKMKNGTYRTNPGALNPEIDHPVGFPNEEVRFLKIVREGGNDIFIVNYGVHTDTVGGDYVSADYPGYVCSTIEGAIPNTNCMFILGPQGDVNHFDVTKPGAGRVMPAEGECPVTGRASHAKYMARVIAGNVLALCDKAKEVACDKITFAKKQITFPSNQENDRLDEARKLNALYEAGRQNEIPESGMGLTTLIAEARRIIRLENGPTSFTEYLHAIRIGDFVFAGLPGEPFTEICRRIYAATPFENMILSCLSNSSGGYYATTSAYSEGGYEAKTSSYKAGVDNVLVEGMTELLNELK